MPIPVTPEFRLESKEKNNFSALYLALLFLSLHWAIVIYINSSFLEQFVSHKVISGLYVFGATFTVIAFFYASRLLNRFGNIRLITAFTLIEFAALIGMAFTHNVSVAVGLFIVHEAIVPLIFFNMDVFMEAFVGDGEESTGGRRGFFLFIMSITYALAAYSVGPLVGSGTPHFGLAYLAGALLLVPFLYIIFTRLRQFTDPQYPNFEIFQGIQYSWKYKDIRNVFLAHFLLQLFFTWMVIYTPLYLATVIGFNWVQISSILFIGLMAYVFLEYEIGVIADKYLGEKEMMAFGFAIMAIATSWFVFLDASSITAWAVAMFMTRVGASFVETTTESYFFKHTKGKDTDLIGLFRVIRPLSYVLGALLGGITLYYLQFNLLFLVLGLLMVPGLFFAMALNDTK